MHINTAKNKIKKAYKTFEFAIEKGFPARKYHLIEYNKIRYGDKLSFDDIEKLDVWFNKFLNDKEVI